MKNTSNAKILPVAFAGLVMLSGCNMQEYADQQFQADLVKAANETNRSLPTMVDKDTRLDSTVAGPGKVWTYMYTLVATDVTGITNERLNEAMGSNIRNSVCTMKEMKLFIEKGVVMKYNYRDHAGNYIGEIVVKPEDCAKVAGSAP